MGMFGVESVHKYDCLCCFGQVDCEMTGLNLEKDKLMEIACIVTEGDTLQTVGNN